MDESAVSESVGVILIVALTVILAAIIAAYAFGIFDSIPTNRNLMISVDKINQTHIVVIYRGGQPQDQTELNSIKIIWPSGTPDVIYNPQVGIVYGPRPITPGTTNHVVIIGNFKGNIEQVLINTYV